MKTVFASVVLASQVVDANKILKPHQDLTVGVLQVGDSAKHVTSELRWADWEEWSPCAMASGVCSQTRFRSGWQTDDSQPTCPVYSKGGPRPCAVPDYICPSDTHLPEAPVGQTQINSSWYETCEGARRAQEVLVEASLQFEIQDSVGGGLADWERALSEEQVQQAFQLTIVESLGVEADDVQITNTQVSSKRVGYVDVNVSYAAGGILTYKLPYAVPGDETLEDAVKGMGEHGSPQRDVFQVKLGVNAALAAAAASSSDQAIIQGMASQAPDIDPLVVNVTKVSKLNISMGCKISTILQSSGLQAADLNNWCRVRVTADPTFSMEIGQHCTYVAGSPQVKFTCKDNLAATDGFRAQFSETRGCWSGNATCHQTSSGCKISSILHFKGLSASDLDSTCRNQVNNDVNSSLAVGGYCTSASSPLDFRFTCVNNETTDFNEQFSEESGCWSNLSSCTMVDAGCKISTLLQHSQLAATDLDDWCSVGVSADANYSLGHGQFCTHKAASPNVRWTCKDKGARVFEDQFSVKKDCWYNTEACENAWGVPVGCKISTILERQRISGDSLNNWCKDGVALNSEHGLAVDQHCTLFRSSPNIRLTCVDPNARTFDAQFTNTTGCWYNSGVCDELGCSIKNILDAGGLANADLSPWCQAKLALDANFVLVPGQECVQHTSFPEKRWRCKDNKGKTFQEQFDEDLGCWVNPHACSCKIKTILQAKNLSASDLDASCRNRFNGDSNFSLQVGETCTYVTPTVDIRWTCEDRFTTASFEAQFSEERGCWSDRDKCSCKISAILEVNNLIASDLGDSCRDAVMTNPNHSINVGRSCSAPLCALNNSCVNSTPAASASSVNSTTEANGSSDNSTTEAYGSSDNSTTEANGSWIVLWKCLDDTPNLTFDQQFEERRFFKSSASCTTPVSPSDVIDICSEDGIMQCDACLRLNDLVETDGWLVFESERLFGGKTGIGHTELRHIDNVPDCAALCESEPSCYGFYEYDFNPNCHLMNLSTFGFPGSANCGPDSFITEGCHGDLGTGAKSRFKKSHVTQGVSGA